MLGGIEQGVRAVPLVTAQCQSLNAQVLQGAVDLGGPVPERWGGVKQKLLHHAVGPLPRVGIRQLEGRAEEALHVHENCAEAPGECGCPVGRGAELVAC